MTKQRLAGEFTGTGQSDKVAGRAVMVSVMTAGNFTATVQLEGRSLYAARVSDTYWAPFATITDAGLHVYDTPHPMEWRLNCTNFTSGNILYTLEASKNTSYD